MTGEVLLISIYAKNRRRSVLLFQDGTLSKIKITNRSHLISLVILILIKKMSVRHPHIDA